MLLPKHRCLGQTKRSSARLIFLRLELTNISNILKAANSSLENVVKVSVLLADLKDFDAMNEVYREFFKGNFPARTTHQAVLRSGRKIEIDCIARVNQ